MPRTGLTGVFTDPDAARAAVAGTKGAVWTNGREHFVATTQTGALAQAATHAGIKLSRLDPLPPRERKPRVPLTPEQRLAKMSPEEIERAKAWLKEQEAAKKTRKSG